MRKFYELPDGQLIEIDSERFESAEILFYPESIGLEQDPLQEMIIKSVASYVFNLSLGVDFRNMQQGISSHFLS